MSDEEQVRQKPDLTALGAHFGSQVLMHTQKHEATAVLAERDANLKSLANRLRNTTNEGFTDGHRPETKFFDVDVLETGPLVAGQFKGARSSVNVIAQDLVNPKLRGSRAELYVQNGPLSALFTEQFVKDSHLDGDLRRAVTEGGLGVNLRLESERGGHKTTDCVEIGQILDPESIMVPEVNEDPNDQTQRFSIIGPSDPRFTPIMDVASHVDAAFGGNV